MMKLKKLNKVLFGTLMVCAFITSVAADIATAEPTTSDSTLTQESLSEALRKALAAANGTDTAAPKKVEAPKPTSAKPAVSTTAPAVAPVEISAPSQPVPAPAIVKPSNVPSSAPVMLVSADEQERIRRVEAHVFAYGKLSNLTFDREGVVTAAQPWSHDAANNPTSKIFNWEGKQNLRAQLLWLNDKKDKDASRYVVATSNQMKKQATIAVFDGGKPKSYTVFKDGESFTATPGFCKILKEQTGAKSFADLSAKAKTCNAFYKRPAVTTEQDRAIGQVLKVHVANLELMSKTVAKELVPERSVPGAMGRFVNWVDRQNDKLSDSFRPGKVNSMPVNKDNWKPRTILGKSTSKSEQDTHDVIETVSEACANLWTDADATIENPITPAKTPNRASPVVK